MINERFIHGNNIKVLGNCCVCDDHYNIETTLDKEYDTNFCSEDCKKTFEELYSPHIKYKLGDVHELVFFTTVCEEDPGYVLNRKELTEVNGGAMFLMLLLADFYKTYSPYIGQLKELKERQLEETKGK